MFVSFFKLLLLWDYNVRALYFVGGYSPQFLTGGSAHILWFGILTISDILGVVLLPELKLLFWGWKFLIMIFWGDIKWGSILSDKICGIF